MGQMAPFIHGEQRHKEIYQPFLGVLSIRGPMVILADDFDAGLHPKLVRAIIEHFPSSKNSDKQLIMNSQDIINMDNKLFRRDEIWFVTRNKERSSVLAPLSCIVNYKGEQIRKDAKYGKQYLEGLYGSDQFIKAGMGLGE